jgi:hypothetical protein
MRTLAILILAVGFFIAVVLPNEIGTHDLPATGAKHVLVKAHPHAAKPAKSGVSAMLMTLVELRGEAALSRSATESFRSVRTVSNLQLCLPLVI